MEDDRATVGKAAPELRLEDLALRFGDLARPQAVEADLPDAEPGIRIEGMEDII